MSTQLSPDSKAILRLHRSWAEGYLVFWYAAVIVLFGGMFLVSKAAGIAPAERAGAYVLLGTLLVLGSIWHAAGSSLARIHMLLAGATLEVPDHGPPEILTGF